MDPYFINGNPIIKVILVWKQKKEVPPNRNNALPQNDGENSIDEHLELLNPEYIFLNLKII